MTYYCPKCKARARREKTDDDYDRMYNCPKCGQSFLLIGGYDTPPDNV